MQRNHSATWEAFYNVKRKMNYLAHLLLSGPTVEIRVGNFIGDSVKGRIGEEWTDGIAAGIKLHRFIDSYADSHPVNMETKNMLRPYFSRYGGVVLDMYHDHFLANHWQAFGEGGLEDFISDAFESFGPYLHLFPEKAKKLYHGMHQRGWLLGYKEIEGLGRAINGVASRTTFNSNMEHGIQVLEEHYFELNRAFLEYFPDVQARSTDYLQDLLKKM